jgi:hypothetical protein
VAAALGSATFEKSLDEGGVEKFWWEVKGMEEVGLTLPEGQGGGAVEVGHTTHIYE